MSCLASTNRKPGPKYQVINGQITREVVVHSFEIYGEEDPIVAAGEPLYRWEQSDAGKWVKEHATETPRWERFNDVLHFIDKFAVIARLSELDITFWTLKFK